MKTFFKDYIINTAVTTLKHFQIFKYQRMYSIKSIVSLILFSVLSCFIYSQNLICDSYLLSLKPIENKNSNFYSINEFNSNSQHWKAAKGSPDIVISENRVFDSIYNCNITYLDTCIGLINMQYDKHSNAFYSECVMGKLIENTQFPSGNKRKNIEYSL